MIEGITTPKNHKDKLEAIIASATSQLSAAVSGGRIDTGVVDSVLSEDTARDIRAALETYEQLYTLYLGALGLLASLAVELREGNNENRDTIETAIVDAITLGAPLNYKRVLDRIDLAVNGPVEEDLEV